MLKLVEPTSATVLAAVSRLLNEKVLEKGSTVFTVLTGSGLKMVNEVSDLV